MPTSAANAWWRVHSAASPTASLSPLAMGWGPERQIVALVVGAYRLTDRSGVRLLRSRSALRLLLGLLLVLRAQGFDVHPVGLPARRLATPDAPRAVPRMRAASATRAAAFSARMRHRKRSGRSSPPPHAVGRRSRRPATAD